MPPTTNQYRAYQTLVPIERDRVWEVLRVLREHEAGQFASSANLVDLMGRDDRISGDLMTRVLGLLGALREIEPAEVAPGDEALAKVVCGELTAWRYLRMFPDAALGGLLRWGIMEGIGLGELVWSLDESMRWWPRLKVWHISHVYWDWSLRRYKLVCAGEVDAEGNPVPGSQTIVVLPDTESDCHSDGRWVLYTPYGYSEGWKQSLVRELATPWLIRGWGYRDWARNSELNGEGILGAKHPESMTQENKERFLSAVANRGAETVISLPQPDVGPGCELALYQSTGNPGQNFGGLISKAEASIGNAILGQSAAGEKPASIGNGQENQDESIRKDIRRADAKITEVLRDQALYWWALYNWGHGLLAPTVTYQVEPPEDEKIKADRDLAVAQTAASLAMLPGSPVDLRAYLDERGFPVLPAGVTPAPTSAPAPSPTLAPAPAPAPAANAEGEPVPVVPLAEDGAPVEQRAEATQDHAQRVAALGAGQGQAALGPTLDTLHEALRGASSFAEVKARLAALAPTLDPSALSETMERAILLSEMQGRLDVLQGS